MGVTIHWKLAQEVGYAEATCDELARVAVAIKKEQADKVGVPMTVRRLGKLKVFVDVGNCETFGIEFKTMQAHKDEYGFTHYNPFEKFETFERTGAHYEKWPNQKLLWAVGFCKTQFAKSPLEHKWVADMLKVVAGRCALAQVNDEGDYYHTGRLEDATGAIADLGAMIDGLSKKLAGNGWEVQKGGETSIKPIKRPPSKE